MCCPWYLFECIWTIISVNLIKSLINVFLLAEAVGSKMFCLHIYGNNKLFDTKLGSDVTKKRPNKEATIQFNIPRSTLSTWNQPISSIFCWIDCFWIFWTTYRSNYRRGWWKWRWRIQWRNCTLLKKWSWRDNQNFKQIKSVHRGFKYWSFNL